MGCLTALRLGSEAGTAQTPVFQPGGEAGLWYSRWWRWKRNFESRMGPRIREYWARWRNFQDQPTPGPGQEWRDRTIIPQAFKEATTRVPRLVMGEWGVPEPYTIQGRGAKDERYEEMVRVLIQTSLDEIGRNDPEGGLFIKRIIDGDTYREIMGHVWWKVWWRREDFWLKTKIPVTTEDGHIDHWEPVEQLTSIYDNIDIMWLPMTSLAVDVHGKRRWAIEYIETSLDSLQAEQENYKRKTGEDLYDPEALDLLNMQTNPAFRTKESTDEPRDTERWPMQEGTMRYDPGERPIELWLCWDNVKRTLTKIANRRVVLKRGYAPTPDGLDPYIGDPAVPIPGRVYGDSMYNWTGGLHTRMTRIARGRMDESLMNLFQQYIMRENTIPSTTWFFRPGGIAVAQNVPAERSLGDSIYLVPRRPLPPEAYNEEIAAQRHSESTAGADAVAMGAEATGKSRDVTAAEVNQRVLQGASRFQLEVLYHNCSRKQPMLRKIFDLLRQNLTTARQLRILDDVDVQKVDLRDLDQPIDIIVGGSLNDISQSEKMQELQALTSLIVNPIVSPFLKTRNIVEELFRSTRSLRRNVKRYVITEDEFAQQQAMAPPIGGAPGTQPQLAAPPQQAALPPGATVPGGPGAAGLANSAGSTGEAPPTPTGGASTEVI